MAGYIYLLGSPIFNWYKIGRSKLPHLRVKQLGILLPFKVELIATWFSERDRAMERELHREYFGNHINGEWFQFTHQQVKRLLLDVPCAQIRTGTTFTEKIMDMKISHKIATTPEEREIKKQQAIASRKKNIDSLP